MKCRHIVAISMGIHMTIVMLICLTGHMKLLPDLFDEHGVVRFMSDSLKFHTEAVIQASTLKDQGVTAFASRPAPLHVKLYSLSLAILSPLCGQTVLSVEPLNVLFYGAILWLIFQLTLLFGSRNASYIAMGAVAIWPSFVLHTTQLLRDPLFIAAILALILITANWLTKACSWQTALVRGLTGAALAAALWLVRGGMHEVVLAIGIAGGLFLLAKQVLERNFILTNTMGAALVIAGCVCAPRFLTPYHAPLTPVGDPLSTAGQAQSQVMPASGDAELPDAPGQAARTTKVTKTSSVARIARLRSRFVDQYPDAGSNIDTTVRFKSAADIVRYLPRACAVGLFAPFPGMWLRPGKSTGAPGRFLGGVETLVMYVIEALAVFGIWAMRRRWATWLLLLVVLIGVTSLGLVVVNIGALYRMRYAFEMLLIPLGVLGAMQLREIWLVRRQRVISWSV